MNRDFLLSATPAVARRLLLLQPFGKIDLPDELIALAQQDCIDESYFNEIICPYAPERAQVTQFLLDCEWRGIVQFKYTPEIDIITMLNAARHFNRNKISVISQVPLLWKTAARSWFLDNVAVQSSVSDEWIDERRDGPLIIDLSQTSNLLDSIDEKLTREFPHCVIYQNKQRLYAEWYHLAHKLFPMMPHPQSVTLNDNPDHWRDKPLNRFALFYNCCIFPK